MACQICLHNSKIDVFKTGRIAICRSCITLLNKTSITLTQAEHILDDYLHSRLRSWDNAVLNNPAKYDSWQVDAVRARHQNSEKFEQRFQAKRAAWLNELAAGKRTHDLSDEQLVAIKVVRAFRRNLLRASPERRANYPKDWAQRSWNVRHADGERCRRCQKTWELGLTDLHVHHIIHKANGGSHHPKNLVTLCHQHHNQEHTEQVFTVKHQPPGTRTPLPAPTDSVPIPESPSSIRFDATQTRVSTNDDPPNSHRDSPSSAPPSMNANTGKRPVPNFATAVSPGKVKIPVELPVRDPANNRNVEHMTTVTAHLEKPTALFIEAKATPHRRTPQESEPLWRDFPWGVTVMVLLLVLFVVISNRGHSEHEAIASSEKGRCSNLELLVQEASTCVGSRGRWGELTRLQELYGVKSAGLAGAHSCPGLLESAHVLGLNEGTLLAISDWMNEHDSNVPSFWKEIVGMDFCAYTRVQAWAQKLD